MNVPPAGTAGHPGASKGHGVEDDRELVERVRRGDGDAYEALVERYGGRLHNMLLHLAGGDAELAGELVQEAFVHAYARLDRFAGASSFYTWLYRLARNRAIDVLARKRPRALEAGDLERAGDRRAAASGPHRAVERDELRDQVRAALARLEPDHREIILLRDFEELGYDRIAELLELPLGTVKSRLNRARRALRDELAPLLEGSEP